MKIIALWHSSETAVLGLWGIWLVLVVLAGGVALLFLAAYLKKKLGRRKD